VVGEQDRLSRLRMRMRGENRLQLLVGAAQQRSLQAGQQPVEAFGRVAEPEPLIGHDLVVPAATGLELPGKLGPDGVADGSLDVHVDVFVGLVPGERAGVDLAGDRAQRLLEARASLVAHQAEPMQLADMCLAGGDIVRGERPVDRDRARQPGGRLAQRCPNAAAPEGSFFWHERMIILVSA
jgi:hypothetical protein